MIGRSGLVVKFVLAMHEPRVRFTAATTFWSFGAHSRQGIEKCKLFERVPDFVFRLLPCSLNSLIFLRWVRGVRVWYHS
jgi:hypothetical protein